MHNYYYFVSALKNISFDMDKPPYDINEFIAHVREVVRPQDSKVIKAFLHQFDNINLINFLDKKEDYNDLGMISTEVFEEAVKDPFKDFSVLPLYMLEFLRSLKEEKRSFDKLSLENELALRYYKYLSSINNEFVSSFYVFDSMLRNLITALNAKKYEYDLEKNVLPLDEEAYAQLIKSRSNDFGLSTNYPWMGDLVSAFQADKHVDLSKKADQLRFEKINELLFFDCFSINVILAYIIKLIIIDKWSRLKKVEGETEFMHKVDRLVKQENFLVQFTKLV